MESKVYHLSKDRSISDDLPPHALDILRKRYLLRDKEGDVIENPEEMFLRVSKAIAAADTLYGENARKTEDESFLVMKNLEFLPNSPVLFNAGTGIEQLASCFVLPIEDSLKGIFETLRNAALIQKTGAGTGFSFSVLRPKGAVIESTRGFSSGPLSFLSMFDLATEVVQSGGRRRGANMGVLRVDHPDICDFITAKSEETSLKNFNLSVSVTDEFMDAAIRSKPFSLRHPRTGKAVKEINAGDIFDLMVRMAWRNGEPGVIFIDRINSANPTPSIGRIEATNPCGEQPLLPYESCVLGSINLAKCAINGTIDWKRLHRTVEISTHFLDNAIDVSKYPLKRIEKMTKSNRKIGLGVMGFADMLIKLNIPYNSAQGVHMAKRIMSFVSRVARQKSIELAEERGSFPNFKKSIYPSSGYAKLRNATLTTIAPTGSISLIAECSSGIEPIYAINVCRKIMGRTVDVGLHPLFRKAAEDNSLDALRICTEVEKHGSIQHLSIIPRTMRKIFVTAFDISPQYHIRMQAAFQNYTDNAVSKTVNMPFQSTVDDVKKVFLLAYRLGCKGITVYRNGSRREQILYPTEVTDKSKETIHSECAYLDCSI